MLKGFRIVYGLLLLTSRWLRRQPTWLIQSTLSYIGFAVLLYAWGGIEGLKNVIIALVINGMWGTGVNIVAQDVGYYRLMRIQDMLIASPVKPYHYIVAIFLSALAFPATSIGVIVFVVGYINAWTALGFALLLGLPVLLAGITIGLSIVLRVEKPVNISAITNPISWLLSILPPVYYPAWLLPEALRPIALSLPTSAAAELARQLTGLGFSINPLYPMVVLVIWSTIGVLLATKTMKWGLS